MAASPDPYFSSEGCPVQRNALSGSPKERAVHAVDGNRTRHLRVTYLSVCLSTACNNKFNRECMNIYTGYIQLHLRLVKSAAAASSGPRSGCPASEDRKVCCRQANKAVASEAAGVPAKAGLRSGAKRIDGGSGGRSPKGRVQGQRGPA